MKRREWWLIHCSNIRAEGVERAAATRAALTPQQRQVMDKINSDIQARRQRQEKQR